MGVERIHRFEIDGRRFAIDPETCFCFECDEISWDVLEYFPEKTVNFIFAALGAKHSVRELGEVIGELEWLRATKSILNVPRREEYIKRFDIERGLKRLSIRLPRDPENVVSMRKRGWFAAEPVSVSTNARDLGLAAIGLLFARSLNQAGLELQFIETHPVRHAELIAELAAGAFRQASLAGKALAVVVNVEDVPVAKSPTALEGHSLSMRMVFRTAEGIRDALRVMSRSSEETLSNLAKSMPSSAKHATLGAVVRPNHARYGDVVKTLDEAGFRQIELDMDGAFIANPELAPDDMLPAWIQSAVYYAERLLAGQAFRLDPIATIFWHIHEGRPRPRRDPVGANELALDERGDIFPSVQFMGDPQFRVGNIVSGNIDEGRLQRFDSVGALTTAPCRACWVRHLCGGGCAGVHHRLTGSYRTPHAAWCDLQREWMAAAVSAFNVLSSSGVNFSRIYQTLARPDGGGAGMRLLTMVRAAFSMHISMRLLEESDAEWLVKWENWNEAAYFTFNESGILLATHYDREMDSLHPQRLEREMVITRRRDGTPIGLLRLRPEGQPGVAAGWVYLHNPADYTSDDVRKGVRFLLDQAGIQQELRRFILYAADYETALHDFLAAAGLERAGILREALYLHGTYRDVHVFQATLDPRK